MGGVGPDLPKRLKPLIPILLPALERHGRIRMDDEARARGGQRRRAGFSSAVRRTVPVRTFGDWNDPPPGYVEVDLVAHGGTSVAGSFMQTVVLTTWRPAGGECVLILAKARSWSRRCTSQIIHRKIVFVDDFFRLSLVLKGM